MSHNSESDKNVVCLGNGACSTAIVKQELIKIDQDLKVLLMIMFL